MRIIPFKVIHGQRGNQEGQGGANFAWDSLANHGNNASFVSLSADDYTKGEEGDAEEYWPGSKEDVLIIPDWEEGEDGDAQGHGTTTILQTTDKEEEEEVKEDVSEQQKRRQLYNPKIWHTVLPNSYSATAIAETNALWEEYEPFVIMNNLVYTANLVEEIDLFEVVQGFTMMRLSVEWNPHNFAAAIVRFRLPKITHLLFAPGKIVCTGAKSPSQAKQKMRDTAKNLRALGYNNVRIENIRLQNMVFTSRLPTGVDLTRLAEAMPDYCTYDSKKFPGAFFRYPAAKDVTVLIFSTGQSVIAGAKSREQAQFCMELVAPIFRMFRVVSFCTEGGRGGSKKQHTAKKN
jgi:transcription initiation factor TFIID TATA-box-binding protein